MENIKIQNNQSEYYFEYDVEKVLNTVDDVIATPKFYFERNYHSETMQYSLFMVPQEWMPEMRGNKVIAKKEEVLFDSIDVVFQIDGVDPLGLSDRNSSAYSHADVVKSITYDDFCSESNDYRVVLNDKDAKSNSGVGVIEMKKGSELIAKFLFSINFAYKNKIEYTINVSKKNVLLTFSSKDRPCGLEVKLLYDLERIPVLRGDVNIESNTIGTYLLNFDENGKATVKADTSNLPSNAKYSVVFSTPNAEKYYLLDCIDNGSLKFTKKRTIASPKEVTCPYCHRPINRDVRNTKEYRNGGALCMALSVQKIINYKVSFGKILNVDKKELSVDLEFQCKYPLQLSVALAEFDNRILGEVIQLDFTSKKRIQKQVYVPESYRNKPLKVIFVKFNRDNVQPIGPTILDNQNNKIYSLNCLANNTVTDLSLLRPLPELFLPKQNRTSKYMYCAEDLFEANPRRFKNEYLRILPYNFLESNSIKVGFVGSSKAGKTSYISRLFGLTAGDSTSMTMPMLKHAMEKVGINSVVATKINDLAPDTEGKYRIEPTSWYSTQSEYTKRAISINPPAYPPKTDTGMYTQYPFIMEVEGNNYVSFYDIAGEDAQVSTQIKKIANDDVVGIFYVINGISDNNGNQKVANEISQARLNKKCPIAVILTKMDALEEQFDPNSKCLRTDYFYPFREYVGSDVEKMINYSGEEIKSYLIKNNLLPDIKAGNGEQFENVQYFGISSFTFGDSVHDNKDNNNEPRYMKFQSSAKHIELPFIWMLQQFGVI